MIPPTPYEHRFTLDGDAYCLVGWTRGADRRIRAEYSMAIAAAPDVFNAIDGPDLYAEAVARECLKEAPDLFWETRPAVPGVNGTPTRVVTLEHVPLELWERFREEVGTFAKVFRPGPTEVPGVAPAPGPGDADTVAALETVPPRLRGRAE